MDIRDEINDIVAEFSRQAGVEEESQPEEQVETPETTVEDNTNMLPLNSESLLVSETTSRFSTAKWYDKIQEVHAMVAGIGGIGSHVTFLLSRLGINGITIIDNDTVDATNLSGQLYSHNNIGESKVLALHKLVMQLSRYHRTNCFNSLYTSSSHTNDIMICGFDNMDARKTYYQNWLRHVSRSTNSKKCLFIDGRLAAEELQVFCINGADDYHKKVYEDNWLFSSLEAEQTICSYKQTTHCATMIGSIIVNLFVNHIYNLTEDILIERPLPFMTSYDSTLMYFKTID